MIIYIQGNYLSYDEATRNIQPYTQTFILKENIFSIVFQALSDNFPLNVQIGSSKDSTYKLTI